MQLKQLNDLSLGSSKGQIGYTYDGSVSSGSNPLDSTPHPTHTAPPSMCAACTASMATAAQPRCACIGSCAFCGQGCLPRIGRRRRQLSVLRYAHGTHHRAECKRLLGVPASTGRLRQVPSMRKLDQERLLEGRSAACVAVPPPNAPQPKHPNRPSHIRTHIRTHRGYSERSGALLTSRGKCGRHGFARIASAMRNLAVGAFADTLRAMPSVSRASAAERDACFAVRTTKHSTRPRTAWSAEACLTWGKRRKPRAPRRSLAICAGQGRTGFNGYERS